MKTTRSQKGIEAQAYLRGIRNVEPGLRARSKIINAIKLNRGKSSREIADAAKISYSAVGHHLRNMRSEKIVEKGNEGWSLTGLGQQTLQGI